MSGSVTGASSDPLENQPLTARREVAASRLGRVIAGRWTLRRVLGLGGTATVYEASHRNGRRAALKVLHPEFATSPAVVRRFLSEGYAANKVGHDGAALVLDDGEDTGLVFLVLELLEGASLAERLTEQGPLPPEEVARVALAVLDVLAAAHDRGVVHRDVKPSNIFELSDGRVKLLDFGVARVREPGSEAVTQSGFTLGTPAYMAPEQAAGRTEEIDALTDIWAVGASMFQLLTGRLVHDAATPNAALVAAATTPVPAIRSLRPSLDEGMARVVDRALAFARDERWPNARAMSRELRKAFPSVADAAGLGTTIASDAETIPESPSPDAPRRSRTIWGVAALALATSAVGAVAAFAGASDSPKPSESHAPKPSSPPAPVGAPVRAGPAAVMSDAVEAAKVTGTGTPAMAPVLPPSARKADPALKPSGPRQARPTLRRPATEATAQAPAPSAAPAPAAAPRDPGDSEETILDRRR